MPLKKYHGLDSGGEIVCSVLNKGHFNIEVTGFLPLENGGVGIFRHGPFNTFEKAFSNARMKFNAVHFVLTD